PHEDWQRGHALAGPSRDGRQPKLQSGTPARHTDAPSYCPPPPPRPPAGGAVGGTPAGGVAPGAPPRPPRPPPGAGRVKYVWISWAALVSTPGFCRNPRS